MESVGFMCVCSALAWHQARLGKESDSVATYLQAILSDDDDDDDEITTIAPLKCSENVYETFVFCFSTVKHVWVAMAVKLQGCKFFYVSGIW